MSLAIITPTRGRPQQFAELVKAVRTTSYGPVSVWAGIDDDDPSDYGQALNDNLPPNAAGGPVGWLELRRGPRKTLTAWTNELALEALDSADPPDYLASLGDDHRPRTPGWDRKLIEAIELNFGSGFAYGNDLFQGMNLPTAWVVSAEIVRALGWMMLPVCEHLYVDAAVLELGRATGRLIYQPGVVIEHLHPVAGKAAWDSSYVESNSAGRYEADRAAFEAWKANGLAADTAAVVEALAKTGGR